MEKTDTKHVRFYYLRDDFSNPMGCVCIIRTDDNKFYRGISLCNYSKGDRFSKPIGRNIAYARAVKATELLPGTSPQNILWGLGSDLSDKMVYIYGNYWLTHKTDEGVIFVNGIEADVDLTPNEKNMWKDILSPESLPRK